MTRCMRTLLTAMTVAAARRPLMHLLRAVLPDESVAPMTWCAAMMAASALLFVLPACFMKPWQSERMEHPMHEAPRWALVLLMSMLGALALPWLNGRWAMLMGLEMKPVMLQAGWKAMLQVTALAIVPAVTEELFFRGAMLSGLLTGCSRKTAVLLTTVSFALMHGAAAGLPGQLIIGGMLSVLMLRTGSLPLTAAAHAVYNVGILCLPAVPGWGAALLMAALAGGAALLCREIPRMAEPRMKQGEGIAAAAMLLIALAAALL